MVPAYCSCSQHQANEQMTRSTRYDPVGYAPGALESEEETVVRVKEGKRGKEEEREDEGENVFV